MASRTDENLKEGRTKHAVTIDIQADHEHLKRETNKLHSRVGSGVESRVVHHQHGIICHTRHQHEVGAVTNLLTHNTGIRTYITMGNQQISRVQ